MTQDDYMGQDQSALSTTESLDEDELRVDPLEKGVEPPEHWSVAIQQAQQEGYETHEQRLNAEEPDVQPPLDDRPASDERPTRRTEPDDLPEEARRGQSADEGAGSVARELRTPPPAV
jgi:hypothetical protein